MPATLTSLNFNPTNKGGRIRHSPNIIITGYIGEGIVSLGALTNLSPNSLVGKKARNEEIGGAIFHHRPSRSSHPTEPDASRFESHEQHARELQADPRLVRLFQRNSLTLPRSDHILALA